MAHFQGITAEIISNGQAMDFYDSPDAAETEESHARHHYVEAVAGSTFEVKVELTSQFNFYNMKAEHAVEIFVEINGRDDGSLVMHCTKEYLQEEFSEGKSDICTFTGPTHFCKETGQWMLSDYSFGNLVLSMLGLPVSTKRESWSDRITRRDSRSQLFRRASSGTWQNPNHCSTRHIGETSSAIRAR